MTTDVVAWFNCGIQKTSGGVMAIAIILLRLEILVPSQIVESVGFVLKSRGQATPLLCFQCIRLALPQSITGSTFMHPIDVLPTVAIEAKGPISQIFLEHGIQAFQEACHYVKAMPYGSNSNNEDSLILFEEGHGTCTTKHGAIARLAQELGIPVYKNLGFYRLNDDVVTGVNEILQPYGLTFIPQIHCFLEYEGYRVDLTEGNCNGKNKTIEDYDFVVRVKPDICHDEERQYYREYLQQYGAIAPQLQAIAESSILAILDACNRQVKYQCSIMASKPQFASINQGV